MKTQGVAIYVGCLQPSCHIVRIFFVEVLVLLWLCCHTLPFAVGWPHHTKVAHQRRERLLLDAFFFDFCDFVVRCLLNFWPMHQVHVLSFSVDSCCVNTSTKENEVYQNSNQTCDYTKNSKPKLLWNVWSICIETTLYLIVNQYHSSCVAHCLVIYVVYFRHQI